MPITITIEDARKIILYAQGLTGNDSTLTGKERTLQIIKQLSYVQIDTLSVAERAHHHVIHSRHPGYQKKELSELLGMDKSIFEYWSHAAAYLPIADYRFSLPRKNRVGLNYRSTLDRKEKKDMKYVLDAIQSNGEMQSKDFEHVGKATGPWFDYKPAKLALERHYRQGTLMVSKRINFHKVYDLTERVLPSTVELKLPTELEVLKHIIFNAIRTQGLASLDEIIYLRSGIKAAVSKALKKMVAQGALAEVKIVEKDKVYYTTVEQLDLLNSTPVSNQVHILSPFDNFTIQRKRLLDIFNFEYLIECYVPEPKRKYGYYVLPILYGDKMVGRLDPKADRKSGVFTIKKLFLEPGFVPDQAFIASFTAALRNFATFCGCAEVNLQIVVPAKYKKLFK